MSRQQLAPGEQPAEPGFQYFLPKQRFTITSTFRLESCPDANGGVEAAARPLIIKQTASAVETSVPDATEFHSIPLSTMTSAWKTTTFSGTLYENQVLHSIGVTVDDRSGAIIKGTLSTAASIARVVIGTPTSVKPKSLCRPEIYQALNTLRSGKAKLLDPSLDEKARDGIAASMISAKGELEFSQTYVFDPTTATSEHTYILDANALLKWYQSPDLVGHMDDKDQSNYKRTLRTGARVIAPKLSTTTIPDNLKAQGVIYREPIPGTLQLCAGPCTDQGMEVLATLETQLAQLGRHVVIPLVNRPFQKNNLSLSFLQNGRLESVTYGSESTLEKMAGSAAESAATIEGYLAKKQAAEEASDAKLAGAELKSIKDETELIKAKADRIEQATRLLNLSGDL
jgi:hypothetical protein